jgi:hypothetical protein
MRKSRKEVQRSREEYESTMAKYLQTHVKQGKLEAQEVELAQTRRRFELARFDQARRM